MNADANMADILDEETKSVANEFAEDPVINESHHVEGSLTLDDLTDTHPEKSDLIEEIKSKGCDTCPDTEILFGETKDDQPQEVIDGNTSNQKMNDLEDPHKSHLNQREPQTSDAGDSEEFDLFKELESFKSQVEPASNSISREVQGNVDWSDTADELLQQLPNETPASTEADVLSDFSNQSKPADLIQREFQNIDSCNTVGDGNTVNETLVDAGVAQEEDGSQNQSGPVDLNQSEAQRADLGNAVDDNTQHETTRDKTVAQGEFQNTDLCDTVGDNIEHDNNMDAVVSQSESQIADSCGTVGDSTEHETTMDTVIAQNEFQIADSCRTLGDNIEHETTQDAVIAHSESQIADSFDTVEKTEQETTRDTATATQSESHSADSCDTVGDNTERETTMDTVIAQNEFQIADSCDTVGDNTELEMTRDTEAAQSDTQIAFSCRTVGDHAERETTVAKSDSQIADLCDAVGDNTKHQSDNKTNTDAPLFQEEDKNCPDNRESPENLYKFSSVKNIDESDECYQSLDNEANYLSEEHALTKDNECVKTNVQEPSVALVPDSGIILNQNMTEQASSGENSEDGCSLMETEMNTEQEDTRVLENEETACEDQSESSKPNQEEPMEIHDEETTKTDIEASTETTSAVKETVKDTDQTVLTADDSNQNTKKPSSMDVMDIDDKNGPTTKETFSNTEVINLDREEKSEKSLTGPVVINDDDEREKTDTGTKDQAVIDVDEKDKTDRPTAGQIVVNLEEEVSKGGHVVVNVDDDDDKNDKTPSDHVVVNVDEEPDRSSGQSVKEVGGKNTTTQSKSESSKESKSKSQKCIVCQKVGKCKYNIVRNGDIKHLCDDKCFKVFRSNPTTYLKGKNDKTTNGGKADDVTSSVCDFCQAPIVGDSALKTNKDLTKSFCKEACRDEYKKKLGICGYCYCDLSSLMTVIKAMGHDVCSKACQIKYEAEVKKTKVDKGEDDVEIVGTSKVPNVGGPKTRRQSMVSCAVCGSLANVKHEIEFNKTVNKLCSDACFSAFRYANKLAITACDNCKKPCGESTCSTIQFMGNTKRFCGTVCLNSFKTKHQKILACAWCQAKKSNFDMVERVDTNNKTQLFCSLNCLSLYRVNLQATSNQNVTCDHCGKFAPAQYHLTMSDASVRNFCAYSCVMAFQAQFQQPQASGRSQSGQTTQSKRGRPTRQTRVSSKTATTAMTTPTAATPTAAITQTTSTPNSMPFIQDVVSLAATDASKNKVVTQMPKAAVASSPSTAGTPQMTTPQMTTPQRVITKTVKETTTQTKVIVQPEQGTTTKNKSVLCKPLLQTKATSCRPHAQSKEVQTDGEYKETPTLIPVPIPIYIPVPMAMYNIPVPYPVPLPIPIPIPCFIPTTKKSAESIMKHIAKIQSSMPADPFEAELLSMAAAVAGEDKYSSSDSDGEDTQDISNVPRQEVVKPPPVEENTEDMLHLAFRMASDYPTDAVLDMEDNVAPMPVNPGNVPIPQYSPLEPVSESPRRGRGKRRGGSAGGRQTRSSKKMKLEDNEAPPPAPIEVTPQEPPPDENMVLKFTYGVNAWKHWVAQKNQHIERTSTRSRRVKLYKSDILACTADELNFQLCEFVKEVRRPNGEEYAPDSIYYLCLGIQEYLYENGRIDNIFTDLYYDQFNENLNQVIITYEVRLNAQGLIVCRIEEEHLWESKQLGAHSPYVLLNTLIYFNTRFFMLRGPDEHLRLSFSHIMKHWKKSNLPAGKQGGRSVYLRYYAPQHQTDANQKRKRDDLPIYEQGENVENPLRCPVKLYEFYLSKCPESIKNRNDVFYLTPERSCVPDSPVWYSTLSLGKDIMSRMLNRLQVVKEIQEAHLAYQPGSM